MVAQAVAKYVRISGRKVNKYGKVMKKRPFREAKAALAFSPSHGAKALYSVIQSAVANLQTKSKNIDEDTIKIESIMVNEGPTLKRWLPRARGRADRIMKRTCHIAVVVSGEEVQK
jgi:large subunit ribosomal protein L22